MRTTILLLLVGAIVMSGSSFAAPEAEEAAIRQAVLDYIEGWYAGDAARMERALHPDLAKRIVVVEDRGSRLDPLSALALVQATRAGWGSRTPADQQQKDVVILDVSGNMASVKLTARDWIDYMHLGKVDGSWVIVNVLWDRKAETAPARAHP